MKEIPKVNENNFYRVYLDAIHFKNIIVYISNV